MANDQSYTGQDFKVVGSRPPRPDGIDKVTGRARYGADAFAPGQLVGRVLRSPHAHAKIRKIDTSRAEKMKGVKAVITSKDLPDLTAGNRGNFDILENCMARDRALYHGHAVAAVAAVDEPTARKALKAIKVDYKVLPHVTDVDAAMADDAPIVQPHVRHNDQPSNIANMTQFGHGLQIACRQCVAHGGRVVPFVTKKHLNQGFDTGFEAYRAAVTCVIAPLLCAALRP